MVNILRHLKFRSTLANSSLYRPDIDGLRALAVLPVLLFHASVPGFTGGFVGVDVFYVISGYLITSIVARDIARGRFSIASFYERRIRRIFPALFLVVLCTLAAASILLAPDELLVLGKSLIALTFFSSNIYFKRHGGTDGYFGDDSHSQALLHTWSLSVEEQFYVVFPTTLLLLTRFAGKRTGALLWLAAAASFGAAVWQTHHQPLSAFYLLIPRAWELLIGVILALKAVPGLQRPAARHVLGLLGLGLLAGSVVYFDSATPFPGAAALLPCIGAWLIIYAGESGPSLVGRILSFRPLVFIGVISYSLYLWHWPLLVFARYFRAGNLSNTDTCVALCASLLLAFLSFEFVESPFRGSASRVSRRQAFSFGVMACGIYALSGLLIYQSRGIPQRFSSVTNAVISHNAERRTDYTAACSNWMRDIRTPADMNFCRLGPQSQHLVMFWGDSHVQQLYPLIKQMLEKGELSGHGALFAVNEGCNPSEHLNRPEPGFHCDSFSRFALARAEQSDIDVVFIGFAAPPVVNLCASRDGQCIASISNAEAQSRIVEELTAHVRKLRALGKRVIVSLPFPLYDRSIPDLQIRNVMLQSWGSVERPTERTLSSMRERIASAASGAGAELFDPRASLCIVDNCITEVAGVSIYKDHSHLAATQVGILENNMRGTLARATLAAVPPGSKILAEQNVH